MWDRGNMEQSQQKVIIGKQSMVRQMTIIASNTPEKEPPGLTLMNGAVAELMSMLQQIETYFDKRVGEHNLETLRFSLDHLFRRVDFLYREALPCLSERAASQLGEETFRRQQTWLQLQAVNRTMDRMTLLCHLLSDAVECLLDTLDNEDLWLCSFQDEITLPLKQVQGFARDITQPPTRTAVSSREAGRWELATTALTDRLLMWQEQHHKLMPFQQQFSPTLSANSSLDELDTAFSVLLDSAGAIFGEILPNFRLVRPEDRTEISALLFDLMQQSDQMLIQFERLLAPLSRLMRSFAAVKESG
ncbi:MAG: hypothetical protein ACRDHZ_21950 [Ktedonobacteraceae bacterium]